MTGIVASAITRELPFLRAEAEARMTSRATIRRKTGVMIKDDNGYESPEWVIVYTDLPCRVVGTAANTAPYRTLRIGDGGVVVAARENHFPALWLHEGENAPRPLDLRDDDLSEITTGDTAGTVFDLIKTAWQDHATARRIPAEQVKRPTEWGDS